MTETFTADADSGFLGCLPEVPYLHFHELPDHPAQRQTKMHAVDLLKCGALNHHLDIHRQVDVVLVGDTTEVIAAYAEDALSAINDYATKLNGHTRDYIWSHNTRPKPETLRIMAHYAANDEASLRLYNSMDAQAAAKRKSDMMQSTLNVADIEPLHPLVQKAGNLQAAVQLAMGVLCGSVDTFYRFIPAERLDTSLVSMEAQFYEQLPFLGQVQLFKDAIIALDALDLSGADVPIRPPMFLAAYLSILQRNPEEGWEFLETLKDPTSGETTGSMMDAFAVVKNLKSHYWGTRRYARMEASVRTTHVLNCILNVFDAWCNNKEYVTDVFPQRPNAISTFNPIKKRAADQLFRVQERQRIAVKQQRKLARRQDRRKAQMSAVAE